MLAKYIEQSTNKKTGTDVTLVTLQSCSKSCFFMDDGCYAQNYPLRFHVDRLQSEEDPTPLQIAKAEAAVIDQSYHGGQIPKGTALRIHVAGECRTPQAARKVALAAHRWICRGGENVWTYTHAWRKVPRKAWGVVSALASVENPADIPLAIEQGYAPALVVSEFPSGRKAFEVEGVKFIPCPAQTNKEQKVQCKDCELCWDDASLRRKAVGIAFEVHGTKARRIREKLAAFPIDIGGKRRLNVLPS